MGALRKFLTSSGATRRTLLVAAMAVVFVRAGLWLLPFSLLLRVLESLGRPSRLGVHGESPTADVAWAVGAVAKRVPVATCLTQALTLNMLLSRRGEASDIKIGIARAGERGLKSHAWVEQNGRVIIGDNGNLREYATLVSLEGAGSLLGRG